MLISDRTRGLVVSLIAVSFIAIAITLVIGAQSGEKREADFRELVNSRKYGDLVLDYSSTVTAEDLGLPLYPKAEVERSYAYSATDKNGKPAGYLAQAFLKTTDSLDEVATFYKTALGEKAREEKSEKDNSILLFYIGDEATQTVRIKTLPDSDKISIELSRASNKLKTPVPVPLEDLHDRGTVI